MVLPNLPQEIITEILTRLPVKSLLRFRCVSKSWLSLINSPQFIKSHLSFSIHNKNCASHILALNCICHLPLSIYSCLLHSAMHETSPVKTILLDSPCNEIWALVDLVGSCNGLICISIWSDDVILWNPSIKKWRKLPRSDAPPSSYVIYGFGYDELNDDYKLVQIDNANDSDSENAVNVYSLRTNSWRSKMRCGLIFSDCAGKFVSGALHWPIAQFDGLNSLRSIVSFNLANETFQNIALPNFEVTVARWDLGVLGGCLCLCCDYYQNRLDLWILENGLKESWTKLISIPYSIDPKGSSIPYSIDPEVPVSPLFVSENGEVLLLYGSQLMLYNKKDKTFCFPDIHMGCGSCTCDEIDACIYVESLVPPNTGEEGRN